MELLFNQLHLDTLTIGLVILMLFSSLILGLIISVIYMFTHKKCGYGDSMPLTLIMLPAIISIIIILVGNSVARAFSLAGAFTLVRYRSALEDPKDVAYIFFTMAIGLCCGMGYIAYGVLFTVILGLVMILLEASRFAKPKNKLMHLKITIPESMNFEGVFDELLDQYTDFHYFKRVRTIDFGSMFEIVYNVRLKNFVSAKAFIDEIRVRNGNMNVALVVAEHEDQAT